MEKENFKAYILYGINGKVTFEECIKNEVLIIIISLLLFVTIGRINKIFLVLGILPVFAYFISVLKLSKKGQIIEGVFYLLHMGIFAICFSYIFGLASIEIVYDLFGGNDRITIIGVIIIGYIAVIFLYKYIIRKLIEENAYGSNSKKLKGGLFFTTFGLLGISTGRIFLQGMDDKSARELLCILSLFLSYLCLMGIFNISKYKYLMEHKELLEDLDTDKRVKQKAETRKYYGAKKTKRNK